MKKTTISASVGPQHEQELSRHAAARNRSKRQLAGFAIVEWLDKNRKQLKNAKHK